MLQASHPNKKARTVQERSASVDSNVVYSSDIDTEADISDEDSQMQEWRNAIAEMQKEMAESNKEVLEQFRRMMMSLIDRRNESIMAGIMKDAMHEG